MGFVETQNNVDESQTEKQVCFGILNGTLGKDVALNVTSIDGTAQG